MTQKKQKIETPLADAFVADIRAAFPTQPVEVRFIYNGSGDDGWFDDYQINFPLNKDDGSLSGWSVKHILSNEDSAAYFNTKAHARIVKDVEDKHDIPDIYRELGEILYQRFPGWEINDGGSGAFIYIPDGKRIHEHCENIMTTNDFEDPF